MGGWAVAALLVISAVILLAMVAVSAYGAVALPQDARVPVHWLTSYGNYVSKRAGLTVWPMVGAVFEGFLLAVYSDLHLRDRLGGLVALTVSMCVVLAFQVGAVVHAQRRTRRPPSGPTAGHP